MKLTELINLSKFSGRSELKEMVLIFKNGEVSCFNTSQDKTVASKANITTELKNINEKIGVASVPIFQKLLSEFDEKFNIKDNKLNFKNGTKSVKLALKDPEYIDTAVTQEKFNDWIKLIDSKKDKLEGRIEIAKLKNILSDAKLIDADVITFNLDKDITINLSNPNGDVIENQLFPINNQGKFSVSFNYALLDVFGINFIEEEVDIIIAKESPMIIKSSEITYLIAPKTTN